MNRQRIFLDDRDWFFFEKSLLRASRDDDLRIMAFALMPNHVHIVAKRGRETLGTAMHRLLGNHSQRFNRRHGRCGHLFQNRFKSLLCDTEEYLVHLIRYVHANPVRAGLVDRPEKYPHSSYHWYSRPKPPHWAETELVDAVFGSRNAAHDFFSSRDDQQDRAVIDAENERRREAASPRVPSAPNLEENDPQATLDRLCADLEMELGLSPGGLRVRDMRHSVSEARRRLTLTAVRKHKIRQAAVARFLGLSPSRISRYLSERTRG